MKIFQKYILLFWITILSNISLQAQVKENNYIDYHVHLQDSATVQLGFRMAKAFNETSKKIDSLVLNADTIIARLNRSKFKGAWIISNAYWFGSPFVQVKNEYQEVKRQNDWTAGQVAQYPKRLIAFMSVNPLKPYALNEIERCIKSKHFIGLKLHFANSRVDLQNKAHVLQLQKIFTLANKNHLILLIHLRSSKDWDGKANAEIFAKSLLPFANQSKIVIAHMGGWGKFDKVTDNALKVLATYKNKGDIKYNNLYFDISAVIPPVNEDDQSISSKGNQGELALLSKRIKEIGTGRILFGTDLPLIEIDEYLGLLKSALGDLTTCEILGNVIIEN